jgi:hypothetical protein
MCCYMFYMLFFSIIRLLMCCLCVSNELLMCFLFAVQVLFMFNLHVVYVIYFYSSII